MFPDFLSSGSAKGLSNPQPVTPPFNFNLCDVYFSSRIFQGKRWESLFHCSFPLIWEPLSSNIHKNAALHSAWAKENCCMELPSPWRITKNICINIMISFQKSMKLYRQKEKSYYTHSGMLISTGTNLTFLMLQLLDEQYSSASTHLSTILIPQKLIHWYEENDVSFQK